MVVEMAGVMVRVAVLPEVMLRVMMVYVRVLRR